MQASMRKRLLVIAFPLAITACATQVHDLFHPPQPVCDAKRVQLYVGRAADRGLAHRMTRLAHAREFRYLRPDTITTREFRADRLDAMLDAHDRITALRCG